MAVERLAQIGPEVLLGREGDLREPPLREEVVAEIAAQDDIPEPAAGQEGAGALALAVGLGQRHPLGEEESLESAGEAALETQGAVAPGANLALQAEIWEGAASGKRQRSAGKWGTNAENKDFFIISPSGKPIALGG